MSTTPGSVNSFTSTSITSRVQIVLTVTSKVIAQGTLKPGGYVCSRTKAPMAPISAMTAVQDPNRVVAYLTDAQARRADGVEGGEDQGSGVEMEDVSRDYTVRVGGNQVDSYYKRYELMCDENPEEDEEEDPDEGRLGD